MQRRLGYIHQYDGTRGITLHLAYQLATDTTRRTTDEHYFVLQYLLHIIRVNLNFWTL